MLAPPTGERGVVVRLGDGGEFVVVGVEATRVDAEMKMEIVNQAEDTATSEVILDAPLVVRVELGAVTLTAREWASLGVGDVIALGRRVSEPVVLRVAGVEVAQGELVDVEGELGVRIRQRTELT
jgi:flagellar motor switch/type III secretory pathway protein FliN